MPEYKISSGNVMSDRTRAIARVMASNGSVRRVLAVAQIETDTASWQGRPGIEVAVDLTRQALKVGDIDSDHRDKIIRVATGLLSVMRPDEAHLVTPEVLELVTSEAITPESEQI